MLIARLCVQQEMYADPESRGGILEPPGTVEVKFRFKDQASCVVLLLNFRVFVQYQHLCPKVLRLLT